MAAVAKLQRYTLLLFAILLLIASKLLAVLHWHYNGGYLDIDRILALLAFLVVCHRYVERIRVSTLGLFAASLLLFYVLNLYWTNLPWERWLQLFILTALVEEILLRGVVFELLLTRIKPKTLLLLSSLAFTAVHSRAYVDLTYALALLASGLILGTVYLYCRRISLQIAVLAASVVHMLIILLAVELQWIR